MTAASTHAPGRVNESPESEQIAPETIAFALYVARLEDVAEAARALIGQGWQPTNVMIDTEPLRQALEKLDA